MQRRRKSELLNKLRLKKKEQKKAEIKAKKAVSKREELKKWNTKQVSKSTFTKEPATSSVPSRSHLRSTRAAPTLQNEIDTNICCTYFVRYEDDLINGSEAD